MVRMAKAKGFGFLLAAVAATVLGSSFAQAQSGSPQIESPRDRQYDMLGRMQQRAAQDAQNTGFFDYVEGEPEKQPSKVNCEVDRMRASTSVMVTGRVAATAPCPAKKAAVRKTKRKMPSRQRKGS